MKEKGSVIKYHYRYTIVLKPSGEGPYIVTCPTLPGLVTGGCTLEETRLKAVDAIRHYLGSLRKDGLPFPVEHQQPLAEQVEIAIDAE